MRPPEFTGGNRKTRRDVEVQATAGFNEAAGIHRRKPAPPRLIDAEIRLLQ